MTTIRMVLFDIGRLAGIMAVGLLTSLLWARVAQDLWRWFVMTQWGVAPLGFWNAAGILLIGGVFTYNLTKTRLDDAEDLMGLLSVVVAFSVLGALVTWGAGWFYAFLGGLL